MEAKDPATAARGAQTACAVRAGTVHALRDAMLGCPARVLLHGHHDLAPPERLILRGCCRSLCCAHTAPPPSTSTAAPRAQLPAGPCGCQCAARFELRGQDFSAKVTGAVVLQSASASITVRTQQEHNRSGRGMKRALAHCSA